MWQGYVLYSYACHLYWILTGECVSLCVSPSCSLTIHYQSTSLLTPISEGHVYFSHSSLMYAYTVNSGNWWCNFTHLCTTWLAFLWFTKETKTDKHVNTRSNIKNTAASVFMINKLNHNKKQVNDSWHGLKTVMQAFKLCKRTLPLPDLPITDVN